MVNGQSQVNVEIIESVLVYGEFVRANTSCPIMSHLPKITFCDIDDDHSGPKEVVKVDGIKAADAVDDVTDSDFGLRAPGTLTKREAVHYSKHHFHWPDASGREDGKTTHFS